MDIVMAIRLNFHLMGRCSFTWCNFSNTVDFLLMVETLFFATFLFFYVFGLIGFGS